MVPVLAPASGDVTVRHFHEVMRRDEQLEGHDTIHDTREKEESSFIFV